MAGARGLALKKPSVIPGFGLALGFTLDVSQPDRPDPARRTCAEVGALGLAGVLGRSPPDRARSRRCALSFGASLIAAVVNAVFGLIVAWVLVRYRFPGRRLARCHRRPALRAADRRRRHRADRALRAERLDRAAARAARHQGRLHADRHHHRAGLHRPALRRAHRAAGDGGDRPRGRGGRGDARRQPLPDDLARDAAGAAAGDPHRLRAGASPAPSANTAR